MQPNNPNFSNQQDSNYNPATGVGPTPTPTPASTDNTTPSFSPNPSVAPNTAQPITPVQQFPTAQPMPMPPGQMQMAYSEDTGKTLSIIGLVLSLVMFMPLIGVILSSIGMKKSHKSGHKGTMGLVGTILGSILLVLQVIGMIMITIVAYNGVLERARENQVRQSTTSQTYRSLE